MTLSELALLTDGRVVGDPSIAFSGFATDSTTVTSGNLFIAIRGARVDGATFAGEALRRGAAAVIAEREVDGPTVVVDGLAAALAKFGRRLRSNFDGPVIGITGSAGKTTTKEFVAAALSPLGPVVKTVGNRNTEWTSPLLWAEVNESSAAVVVEMAMRGHGQIAHLASVAQPTIGVVTNIGYSHLLQVGSREGIAAAKGELLEALPANGTAIAWHDDAFLPHLRGRFKGREFLTFGFHPAADCTVERYELRDWSTAVAAGVCRGEPWEAELPLIGRHIALNAAAAILAAQAAGVLARVAAGQLRETTFPGMRMEVRKFHGANVLLDAYNASPPSMLAAIETLAALPVEGRRFAIIGEMKELGDLSEAGHLEVAQALIDHQVPNVMLVGEGTIVAQQKSEKFLHSDDLAEVRRFLAQVGPGDAVLIKGSRALGLERLLEGWEESDAGA